MPSSRASSSHKTLDHVLDEVLALLHRREWRMIDLFRSHALNSNIDHAHQVDSAAGGVGGHGNKVNDFARAGWLCDHIQFSITELDRSSLSRVFRAAGLKLSNREYAMVFAALDRDGNGVIDLQELERALHCRKLQKAIEHEIEHDPIARLAARVRAGHRPNTGLVHASTVRQVRARHLEELRAHDLKHEIKQHAQAHGISFAEAAARMHGAGGPAVTTVPPRLVKKVPGNLYQISQQLATNKPRKLACGPIIADPIVVTH